MDEIAEGFNAALAALPLKQQRQVDDRMSTRSAGIWELRDSRGAIVAKVKDRRFEAPPSQRPLRPNVATRQYVMDVAKSLINTVSEELASIRGSLGEVATKAESAVVNKALDTQIVEVFEEIQGRLQSLESSVEEVMDHGFRYRGFWREGMSSKRGDAFTEDGSLWICLRSTKDRPGYNSPDWHIAVRKGRNGRDARDSETFND
jgi:hypothetical protein